MPANRSVSLDPETARASERLLETRRGFILSHAAHGEITPSTALQPT